MNLKTFCLMNYEVFRPSRYRLDEYPVRDGKKHPFAIICPGGAYRMVASHVEGIPIARALNELGYSAFVLWYGYHKRAAYPRPIDDLARAVRELNERADELNLDVGNYSVWGASAGGHVAASFATKASGYIKYGLPKPNALVLIYPVVTMGEGAHLPSRKRHIGRHPTQEAIQLTSVERQVDAEFSPTFVWYGDRDACVNPENSKMLDTALAREGVLHETVAYRGVGHGVGLGRGTPCEDWFRRAVAFWEKASRSQE